MLRLDKVEISVWTVIGMGLLFVVIMVAGQVGVASWEASEKAAAYKAYVQCLEVTKHHTIDVQQSFCGRIRDQL